MSNVQSRKAGPKARPYGRGLDPAFGGSDKPIYVGLDVHKRQWTVTVLCQGEELYHATVVLDPAALVRCGGTAFEGRRS